MSLINEVLDRVTASTDALVRERDELRAKVERLTLERDRLYEREAILSEQVLRLREENAQLSGYDSYADMLIAQRKEQP
jgi:Zn-dependent oligopeptidase